MVYEKVVEMELSQVAKMAVLMAFWMAALWADAWVVYWGIWMVI